MSLPKLDFGHTNVRILPSNPSDMAAEIERLSALRHMDNEALATAWDESRDGERAATVAWLRRFAEAWTEDEESVRSALMSAATLIERGVHRQEEP